MSTSKQIAAHVRDYLTPVERTIIKAGKYVSPWERYLEENGGTENFDPSIVDWWKEGSNYCVRFHMTPQHMFYQWFNESAMTGGLVAYLGCDWRVVEKTILPNYAEFDCEEVTDQ